MTNTAKNDTHGQLVHNAAVVKFGEVIGFDTTKHGDFCLLIKRDNCPFADRPYMTIKASVIYGVASFYWGHYDLTKESAHEDFQERL